MLQLNEAIYNPLCEKRVRNATRELNSGYVEESSPHHPFPSLPSSPSLSIQYHSFNAYLSKVKRLSFNFKEDLVFFKKKI